MKHLCDSLAQLFPQALNKNFLWLDIDDTHKDIVKNKHALSKHCDLMCLLCE